MGARGDYNYLAIPPILIVDDDLEQIRDVVEYLRRNFHPVPVIGYSASREAAALLARQRLSLLICNRDMPRVGGIELMVLARKRWGTMPTVVLVSAGSLGSTGCIQVRDDTIYLEKPCKLDTLCECISALAQYPLPDQSALLVGTMLVDPAELIAGLAQDDEPSSGDLVARHVLLPATEEPAIVAPIASSATTGPLTAEQDGQGADRRTGEPLDFGELDLRAGRSEMQDVSGRPEDLSLSSETPLPPPSQSTFWQMKNEASLGEVLEILDEELELIEFHDGTDSPDNNSSSHEGETDMALTTSNIKENLARLEGIDGFIGVALADSDSGMCVGYLGGGGLINLEVAAAANTEVVRSKRKAIKTLNLRDEIEDILISLGKQYHLIRPVRTRPNLFFYLVLDRQRANLAMARYTLADAERDLPM